MVSVPNFAHLLGAWFIKVSPPRSALDHSALVSKHFGRDTDAGTPTVSYCGADADGSFEHLEIYRCAPLRLFVMQTYEVTQNYVFRSPPKKIFEALTVPTELVKWFLSNAKLEAKKGGSFAFDWTFDSVRKYHMDGKVLEVVPDTSITFLWVDSTPDGKQVETEANFRVTPIGSGSNLELHHTKFTDPLHFAECGMRWAYYLTNLKSVVDHGVDLRSPGDW
jgi:uncharacterized protein YndB with AHSA1/START domain